MIMSFLQPTVVSFPSFAVLTLVVGVGVGHS
jgi:hypothetical protein